MPFYTWQYKSTLKSFINLEKIIVVGTEQLLVVKNVYNKINKCNIVKDVKNVAYTF